MIRKKVEENILGTKTLDWLGGWLARLKGRRTKGGVKESVRIRLEG